MVPIEQLCRTDIDGQGFDALLTEMDLVGGEVQRLKTMLHALLARDGA